LVTVLLGFLAYFLKKKGKNRLMVIFMAVFSVVIFYLDLAFLIAPSKIACLI
jgi:uncharacterized membrane protein